MLQLNFSASERFRHAKLRPTRRRGNHTSRDTGVKMRSFVVLCEHMWYRRECFIERGRGQTAGRDADNVVSVSMKFKELLHFTLTLSYNQSSVDLFLGSCQLKETTRYI